VSQSAQQAQQCAQEIIADAQKQAQALLNQARLDAEAVRNNAREAMEDEMAALAVSIAAKLLAREVRAEDHQRLIEEFLDRVG
ncbi:MAG: hypothetical protein RR482_03890, partial [Clostridia bacterium]